jgi:MFS family permease
VAAVTDEEGGQPTGKEALRSPRWWTTLRADVGPLRRSHEFRLLFAGQVVSLAGSMLTYVALPYQAYQVSHSSLVVGLLSLAEVVPYLFIGLVGGAFADAVDRRRLVLFTEVGLAVGAAALIVNAATGDAQLWALFAISFLMAVLGALQRPSLTALLPRVVDPAEIPAATTISTVGSNIGQVAGPALAGTLIAAIGLSGVYSLDTATFVVSLIALWRMAAVPPPPEAQRPSLARIVEGFRYAASRSDLLGTYAVDMAAMFFGMPEALFPQLASRLGGPEALGVLFAAPAVGSLVVSSTAGWVQQVARQGRAIILGAGSWGIAVVALGLAPNLGLAFTALVVAGGFDMVSGLMRSTIWNQSIPDSVRGRLAGIELVSFTSGPALGNLEAGLAETLGGLRFAIISGGAACVAATVVVATILPGLWQYDAHRQKTVNTPSSPTAPTDPTSNR